jgi:hypothetical protein
MAAYNIGQMEWNAAAPVDEAYVDEFRDNNVYTRFANPNGGNIQLSSTVSHLSTCRVLCLPLPRPMVLFSSRWRLYFILHARSKYPTDLG